MFRKIAQKYKKLKDNRGGVFSLLAVSLIIFALCAAIYVVGDYVTTDDGNAVYMWSYSYTENAGAVPEGQLRIISAQNPIITEASVKKSNIYLKKMIEPSDKENTLVILTDHSPLMITVNGKEVYNNQFETAQYVGNCYNAVKLEPSEREQEVEVFMKLPFSVRFEASYSDTKVTAFNLNASLIAAVVLLVLGLIALLVFAFLSVKKHKLYRSVFAAALLTYVGAALTLTKFSEASYLLNAPMWMNISTALAHLTFVIAVECIASRVLKRKKYQITAVAAGAVILVALAASMNTTLFFFAEIIATVTAVAFAVYCAYGSVEFVLKRALYAVPVFVISSFYSLTALVSGLLLISRSGYMYAYSFTIPTLVLIGVLEYVNIADYRYLQKNSDLRDQTSHYSDSVDSISRFIRNMIMCDDADTFFKTAAWEMSVLLQNHHEENSDLHCCVGVKTEDGYEEVVNTGVSGCRYELIEKNSVNNDKDCIFSETYFDLVLKSKGEACAFMHFENIVKGLDLFFISMIEAAYCGLETAYEKVFENHNNLQLDVIFTKLAENSEVDNGYSPEHLVHIAEYVYMLCKKLGMGEEESRRMSLASKLHDIGKIAIPKTILNKEGKLTQEEQVIVSCHAKYGYLILSAYTNDPLLSEAAVIARYHHERFNGSGTNGLKGEEIPLSARITTVCDVYDALVSVRPYKQAWSKDKAQSFLKENSGSMFDPEIVKLFLDSLSEI